MFKELILAVALGALLGFGVTGGLVAMNQNKNSRKPIAAVPTVNPSGFPADSTSSTVSPIPTPSTPQVGAPAISIDSPANESFVNSSKITVTGTTTGNNLVVIHTPINTYQTIADNAGNFTVEVELETGFNLIKISSVNDDSIQSDTQLLVTYTTAKI